MQSDLYDIADNERYLVFLFHKKLKNTTLVYGYDSDHLPNNFRAEHISKNSDIFLAKNNMKINNVSYITDTYFYIANTLRVNAKNQPIYGLYEKMITPKENRTLELAEGVKEMHINFGIGDALGKNIIAYLDVNQINFNEINKIKSVELKFIISSIDNQLQEPLNIYINLRH